MDLPRMRREAKQTITLMTMVSPELWRGCICCDYPTQLLQSLLFIIQLSLQFQTVRQSKSCWVYIYASLSKSIQGPVKRISLWVHRKANWSNMVHLYRFFFHLKTFKYLRLGSGQISNIKCFYFLLLVIPPSSETFDVWDQRLMESLA